MAYKIVNANRHKDGSFGWRIRYVFWKKGKEAARHVKSSEWAALGFRRGMSREEAEALAKTLNEGDKRVRREKKRQATLARIADEQSASTAWLPQDVVRVFETGVLENHRVRPVAWRRAKLIIIAADTPPWDWVWYPAKLYEPLIAKAYSVDFSQRVWHALKIYCGFYCAQVNRPTVPLPDIPTVALNKIKDAYWKAKGTKFKTLPLTEDLLKKAKQVLPENQHNWLLIAHYFGLRPEEMTRLTQDNNPRYWFITEGSGDFPWALHVYQKKLEKRGIEEEHRWKAIPAAEPEQQALRKVIESGNFKMPFMRKLQEKLAVRIKLRSCRRDFRPWLLSRGYSKRIASIWLGHVQPETKMADERYGGEHWVEYEAPVQLKKAG